MNLICRFFINILLICLTGCSLLSFAAGSPQDEGSIKNRYQQAKFYYNQLETSGNLGQERENWVKSVRNFRRIYLASPKSEYAPFCLYMLGKVYHRMYEKFDLADDLAESLSYYRDTSSLFPDSQLADDALFAAGNILLMDCKSPQKAGAAFSKIITEYKGGDMYSQAESMLKSLSRDHDIPLPREMVSRSLKDLRYVLPVKYWSSKNYTRVVVKASGPVAYHEQLLEKSGDKPRRLYIDFKNSYIEPKYRAPVPIQNGLLKQIRTGQYRTDTVRVVLDIESISDYKIFSLPDPFRVVIDVRGQGVAERINNRQSSDIDADVIVLRDDKKRLRGKYAQTRPPLITRSSVKKIKPASTQKNRTKSQEEEVNSSIISGNAEFSLAQQLGLGVRKIVIDPGHGGKDPGAAAFGVKEKDIVLQIARKLAAKLESETGAEVLLTRDKDTFIPLEERTAIANTSDADLFISLHINAHPSSKVRGIETYYLNLSTNAEAMRVAARENATSTHQMSDLQDILSDIMKNSKINESARLAKQVHGSIIDGLKQSKKFADTKNLDVKQAPFYVLIGAEMPAILLELGFISNPKEVERLQNKEYLEIITDEIAAGIKHYINNTTAGI
ncbi:MAG: hypothetical protein CSB24_05370 [Deltaproteobacteria bacterium]|nr:MAG: hypothetical protein CSB24_05370 [Deltaproteobacteria bacterium]